MNDIKKNAVLKSLSLTEEELVKINQFALKELTADEVFTFKLAACNNDIDRDFEAFTSAALHKLAELYVGKTIIQDHRASTANQCARIYDAEVEATGETSKTGEPFERLILHCYCLRANNEELIADIEAGIKKECSVGCAIGKAICSICEQDNAKSWCEHYPSKTYDGRLCYFKLDDAKDAYEVSFVAIPAQPAAGITKSYGGKKTPVKNLNIEIEEITTFIKEQEK
ncbi:MAG: hypothetical protein IJF40_04655 [Clostridia bacterium]|nr:hypothetical protein [Clostridia bacterium]